MPASPQRGGCGATKAGKKAALEDWSGPAGIGGNPGATRAPSRQEAEVSLSSGTRCTGHPSSRLMPACRSQLRWPGAPAGWSDPPPLDEPATVTRLPQAPCPLHEVVEVARTANG